MSDDLEGAIFPWSMAPKRISKQLVDISLTGMLLPLIDGNPCWLKVPASPHVYLPVFTTEEKLRSSLDMIEREYDKISIITNGITFLSSIPLERDGTEIKIAIDVHLDPDSGKSRWAEIQR